MNFSFFADIFFPSVCLACGKKTPNIPCCEACRGSIVLNAESTDSCHAAARYDDPVVQHLVRQLKFNYMRSAALPLAEIIAGYAAQCRRLSLPTLRTRNAVLVPIPLSRRRERQRGFNQSALIANHLGAITRIPVAKDILARERHAKPQSEMASAADRKENIRGVFAVRSSPPKTIILIDDVVTTGATFHEAKETLRTKGARCVVAIAAARS